MRVNRIACLVVPWAGLLAGTGCQLTQPHTPVTVRVIDAETKAPVAGATVKVSDVLTQSAGPPQDSTGVSGPDGVARLRLAPEVNGDIAVEVSADGRMTEIREVPVGDVPPFDSTRPFQSRGRPPIDVVVEVYADPRPTAELVLPYLFHGPIKLEVKADDSVNEPGRRAFGVVVPDSGAATLTGSGVLRHLMPADVTAKTADGAPVGRNVKEWEVGLRWVRSVGTTQHFFVGTQRECDDYRKSLEADPATHSGGEKKGGRRGGGGGGGRRGGGGGRGGMGGGMGGGGM